MKERTTVLHRAANELEKQTPFFCALLVKEAFKTWGDAVIDQINDLGYGLTIGIQTRIDSRAQAVAKAAHAAMRLCWRVKTLRPSVRGLAMMRGSR